LWEITIKSGIGKLDLGTSPEELFSFLERNRFIVLEVEFGHRPQLSQLPAHHRDPFDRLIIAQALAEK
jgi:PIN domain nuclease of toxin-antitoxin system